MKTYVYVLIAMVVFNLNCNFFGSDTKKQKDYHDKIQEKFHTRENPGKWKNQADEHVPHTIVKKKDKKYIIAVQVPFVGSVMPVHYIETIILLDHNHNEMQKVTFKKWDKIATARFILPEDYKSYLYVVAKCNLHDMWRIKVVLE